MNQREDNKDKSTAREQGHVHELQGSVRVAELNDLHGHRFCTVTGEVIPVGDNDHIHEVAFFTDFYDGHYHEFRGRTGGVVQINDRHVHYMKAATSTNDKHSHEFEAVTMINNPTGDAIKETLYYEDIYPYEDVYRNEDDDRYEDDFYQFREDNYQRY